MMLASNSGSYIQQITIENAVLDIGSVVGLSSSIRQPPLSSINNLLQKSVVSYFTVSYFQIY